jgi:hypothetical protein
MPVLAQIRNPSRAEKSAEGRPDLGGIPTNEAKAIENACDSTRRFRGPGEYYQCLQRELITLQRFLGPTKRLTTVGKGKEQREKSVERETSTGKYTTSPKEELGNKPFPDSPPPKLPQATHATQPRKTPEMVLSLVAFGFIILFFIGRAVSKQGASIPFLIGRTMGLVLFEMPRTQNLRYC